MIYGSNDDTRCWRALECVMSYGPQLPLRFMAPPYSRLVRMLALVWFALWLVPSVFVCLLPMIALMVGDIIESTWNGKL